MYNHALFYCQYGTLNITYMRLAYALRGHERLPTTFFYDVYIHDTPLPRGCVFLYTAFALAVHYSTLYTMRVSNYYIMQLYEIR